MVHCTTMVEAGVNLSVLLAMIDPFDPFEVDKENGPHLAADVDLSLDDALDVLTGDPEFYVDETDGSADWLMVGPIPGGQIIVVPMSESRYSGYSKVRPITILKAPMQIEQRYLDDKGGNAQ